VLLIIAGIVLAIALFGAGAFWRGKVAPKRSSELHIAPPANIRRPRVPLHCPRTHSAS
jgi:hypothetical protein